ncbi:hypothetical protein NDU88_004333 [Pleurodeles waltl]|uniref:Secreted protein n=1 Tax=Pleurodeles waltl TaxID=8319 RepID=A0AAV7UFB2_PLEWA|nr:hypothetical protein NDU88_004333 [Pleurodeles waltl]
MQRSHGRALLPEAVAAGLLAASWTRRATAESWRPVRAAALSEKVRQGGAARLGGAPVRGGRANSRIRPRSAEQPVSSDWWSGVNGHWIAAVETTIWGRAGASREIRAVTCPPAQRYPPGLECAAGDPVWGSLETTWVEGGWR